MTEAVTLNGSEPGSIERVRVVEMHQRKPTVPESIQNPPLLTPEPRVIVEKAGVADVMIAAFTALGFAVSARVLLFLSLLGAFALTVMAMLSQTNMAAVLVGLYCVLTTLPLVYLETRSRKD